MRKLLAFFVALFFSGVAQLSLAQTELTIASGSKYVALGSSFGAGPGVGERASDSPSLCQQSGSNYAHLLAATRHLQLVDRTCGGATTADILSRSQFGLPPQVTDVDDQTRLVTITIGGNDIGYIANLWAESCALAPQDVPAAWQPYICKGKPDAFVQAGLAALPERMREVALAIRLRAPQAKIIFVTYAGIVPTEGSCNAKAPLTQQEQDASLLLAQKLVAMTTAAALEQHASVIYADILSQGHDVCSADPWVFPFTFPPELHSFAPVGYHPNAAAMQAIADALDRMLH
jgi:lysophospholipase L1-like esterase